MISLIKDGAGFLTYELALSNLLIRYYVVMEFACGQNVLKVLLYEILESGNGLSVYNILDIPGI